MLLRSLFLHKLLIIYNIINFAVGIVNYNTLTERINHICYKLEYYTFLSAEDRANLLKELNKLIDERNKLAETLSKNEKHRK